MGVSRDGEVSRDDLDSLFNNLISLTDSRSFYIIHMLAPLTARTTRITDGKLRYHDKKVKTDALNSERIDKLTPFFH